MNALKTAITLCLFFFSSLEAAVVKPALDIQDLGADSGGALTATTFNVDATAIGILTNGGSIDIPDQVFTLTSTGYFVGNTGSFSGSFAVGGGSYLSGTFTDLLVVDFGGGNAQYTGDVSYTGGSLQGALTGGSLEGVLSSSSIVATLGPVAVVPVPAAIWLFGSGVLGLIAVARRTKAV